MDRGVSKHVIAAVALLVFDGFVFGQVLTSALAAPVMLVIGLVEIALGVGSDRPRWRRGIWIVAIYLAAVVAASSIVRINARLANERAHRIVAALEAYNQKHQRLPDRLVELVPEYLPKVPLAKYTVGFNEFHYAPDGLLSYTAGSPFAHITYRLDTRTWGYQE